MKKTKIILSILGGVVVLIAIVVFFLIQNLNGIVKTAIEKYGTEAAGTPVRVQKVKLELREGRGTVSGLTVGNPQGFSRQPIFRLGQITVALDIRSLTSDLPVVKLIKIGAPSFRYEVDARGRTNLGELQRNIKQFSAVQKQKEKTAPKKSKSAGPHLLIKRLSIQGGQGILDLRAVGGKTMEAKLPPIALTDLGGRQGISPSALGRTILNALVTDLQQTAVRQGAEQVIRQKLGGAAGKLEEQMNKKLGPGAGGALKKILGQ